MDWNKTFIKMVCEVGDVYYTDHELRDDPRVLISLNGVSYGDRTRGCGYKLCDFCYLTDSECRELFKAENNSTKSRIFKDTITLYAKMKGFTESEVFENLIADLVRQYCAKKQESLEEQPIAIAIASADTTTADTTTATATSTSNSTSNSTANSTAKATAEVDISKIDYSSEEIHEEVELLLASEDPLETLQLIATMPKYYLSIIQNYKLTRKGEEIYLPNLLNIIQRRVKGRLIIKFKAGDNEPWNEVGYDSDQYGDDETYKAFSEKVDLMARHHAPRNSRSHINAHFDDAPNAPNASNAPLKKIPPPTPVSNQGNQAKITKIDRFLGKQPPVVSQPDFYQPLPLPDGVPTSLPVPVSVPIPNSNPAPVPTLPTSSRTVSEESSLEDPLPALVRDYYENQNRNKNRSNRNRNDISQRFAELRSSCPVELINKFDDLQGKLDVRHQFAQKIVSLMQDANPKELKMLCEFTISILEPSTSTPDRNDDDCCSWL